MTTNPQPVSIDQAPLPTETQADYLPKIVRNSAFVISVQVVMKILGFAFNVYVVRRLGASHFGMYATVVAFVGIFAIFSDMGMAPLMLREIARDRENVYWLLPNVVAIRFILSAGVVVVATAVAYLLGKEPAMVFGIFLASCGLFLYAFQGPLDATLMAWERLDYSSTFTFVNQLIFWALGFLALVLGWGFVGLIIASLFGVLAMAAMAARIVLREIDVHRLQWAPKRWKELLRACLPFGISSFSFSLRQRFDTVLMSVTLDDAIVGLYNVPLQLIGMMMLLAQSISTSMFPSLTRAFKEGWSEVHSLVHRAFKYLLMLSLPIAVGTTLLAERIVILLYTEEFRGSILLLQILIWTLPFLFVSELMGSLIMALQKEREGARVNVINAGISMAFTAVLLPIFGAIGASAGRVSVLGIRLGQYWRLLGSRVLVGETGLVLLRVFLANAAMGICVYFARELPLFAVIGIGVLSYPVFLFAFRAVTISEVSKAVNLIFRREQHELAEPIH